jgi:hypothetical protein
VRELGRADAVCFLIAAIVVLDTLGAVAREERPDGGVARARERPLLRAGGTRDL